MKYDLSKHSLIEDNGDLVAVFSQSIRADKAFEIADKIDNAKTIEELEGNIEGLTNDCEDLKKDAEFAEKDIWRLEDEKKQLDDRLQSITNMLEGYYKFASIQDLKEEIISICAAPL